MPAGEASRFPPPFFPSVVTFANYRELFARVGMGRYFVNSLLVSLSITFGSVLFNTMAGYAFAKLRFVGRERVFSVASYGVSDPSTGGDVAVIFVDEAFAFGR